MEDISKDDCPSAIAPFYNADASQRRVLIDHDVPAICFEYGSTDTTRRDVTITVGGRELYVHSALIAARIPFFASLFDAGCSTDVFDLSQLDFSAVRALLDYAYNGCATLTEDNIAQLIVAADFLHIQHLLDACIDSVNKLISVRSALALYGAQALTNRPEAIWRILNFIDCHFVAISKTPEFLKLPIHDLAQIVASDSLHVESEIEVLLAVSRWIEADKRREEHAERLLECVRCTRIPAPIMSQFVKKSVWIRAPDCMAIVTEARMRQMKIRGDVNHALDAPRSCTRSHEKAIIFTSGIDKKFNGRGGDFEFTYKTRWLSYDAQNNRWTRLEDLPITRAYGSIAVIGKEVFVFGGHDGKHACGAGLRYDTAKDVWTKMPEMMPRSFMASGVINGKIIVAGGIHDREELATAEMFDPSTEEWKCIAPMSKPRSAAASCVCGGKLYVFGGNDGNNVWDDGECNDLVTDTWTAIASMHHTRFDFAAATLNGQIYVVGGTEQDGAQDVERYDPITDTWTKLNPTQTSRDRSALAVICGKMYVFGGSYRGRHLESVEVYDPDTDSWEERAPMLTNCGTVVAGVLSVVGQY